ncbi:Ring finger domain-containing protein [Pleurostoma richardsiae]|uniref:RING-type E3 ubiquitin transferase n=1 Tax=Pleurostoma richardsiae TaxID=41990 RepID=A0AA38RQX7_9PEZI|nr:Ring finger domain-containing protein [Pleurostoma richardsiae]
MASSSPRAEHLDAFAGRDVVYCHQCENEWYQDEHGLQCPRCLSEATEIITPENDPRDFHREPSPPDFGGHHRNPFHSDLGSDSDPEEADIDEQIHTGPGFTMRRVVYRSPNPGSGTPREAGDQGRTDPGDGDAILRRFTDMLMQDFNVGSPGRSGPDTLFPPGPGDEGMGRPRQFHTTTFSGPGFAGGTATLTIATTPLIRGRGGPSSPPGGMDFDTVFGNIMGNIPPPDPSSPNAGNRAGGAPPLPGFAIGLQEILASLLNPAAAVHGDAVYTQEALDRIITSLMEANPQSNAAPPASQGAIDKLEKKKLDRQMLGTDLKSECTICIDDINLGDEVTVLPCKHWFHGECVVLWLKEHNTCPICRHPIEERNNRHRNSNSGVPQPQNPAAASEPQASTSSSQPSQPPQSNPYRRRERLFRTPSENEERLNAIRSIVDPDLVDGRNSSRYRRDSYSPPRPGMPHHSHSDESARRRARESAHGGWRSVFADREDRSRDGDRSSHHDSPVHDSGSGSSERNAAERGGGNQGSGSHNPLTWLRDQFSRNPGSGSGNGRRRS